MLDPPPRLVVRTAGGAGGSWESLDGTSGGWAATPLPGPVVDAYGCGDSFAAALAYGLGTGMGLDEAIALAARCGAACLCGRGPYVGQLGPA
jgi:ribokinase